MVRVGCRSSAGECRPQNLAEFHLNSPACPGAPLPFVASSRAESKEQSPDHETAGRSLGMPLTAVSGQVLQFSIRSASRCSAA